MLLLCKRIYAMTFSKYSVDKSVQKQHSGAASIVDYLQALSTSINA